VGGNRRPGFAYLSVIKQKDDDDVDVVPHRSALHGCELLLNVGYTQVVGQPLKHLVNKTIKGVLTHVVGPNTVIRRLELWNVTVQCTCAPISMDSPGGNHI